MEKLQPGSPISSAGGIPFLIDLSSWHKESLAPKIEMMYRAIAQREKYYFHIIHIKSIGWAGVGTLIFGISLVKLVCVLGFLCEMRKDFRLFKLNRMDPIRVVAVPFTGRSAAARFSTEHIFPGEIRVKALFEPEVKWRLVEDFGPHCFEAQEDGRLFLFCGNYTDRENLICWLLTFGNKAELLEPKEIRDAMRDIAEQTVNIYKKERGR